MTQAIEIGFLRILLVEDNPSDAFLLRTALGKAGLAFELTVIDDGALALAEVQRMGARAGASLPDVILLDLNLPKHSGLEILETIKQSPALARIPAAIYTSSDSADDRRAAERLGADRYIVKPNRLAGLAGVAAIVVELGRPGPRAS